MKTGEVYAWVTTKAKGHEQRFKYHIFICEADGFEENTFLFINSEDYGGDLKIEQKDHSFLTKAESFISCSAPVFYDDAELKAAKPELKGALARTFVSTLYNHILGSQVMEARHIKRVCNALRTLL